MKIKKKYIIIPTAILLIFTSILLSFNKVASAIIPKLIEINVSSLTPEQNKTLDSLKKVDNHPLYVMDYYGDYSQFLKLKEKYYWFLGIPKPKCSTFAITDQNGDSLFGRNNDNADCPVMLLFTHPKDGYDSVSVVSISGLGFDTGNKSPLESKKISTRLLYTPFFSSDGMNEWGLAIGDMSVPGSKVSIDPDKDTMFDGEMKRYILDHAKNTDEAIEILSRYNVSFSGLPQHYLISDPSGNSAVIEWVDGQMQITKNKAHEIAATNFMCYGSEDIIKKCENEYAATGKIQDDINGKSYWRYITIMKELRKDYDTEITTDKAMHLLSTVSFPKGNNMYYPTQWSVVYDMNSGEINIAMGRNYDNKHGFKLEMQK